MGGLFWRLETTSNDLDPEFDRSSLRLSRFFCPNFGDFQKKRSSLRLSSCFCPNLGDLQKQKQKGLHSD